MSKPRITTLMEDTLCGSGLEAEHGLSLYIETEKHKILADTGQSAKTWIRYFTADTAPAKQLISF